MVKPAVIGNDGRSSALVAALLRSPRVKGPVLRLSSGTRSGAALVDEVVEAARARRPDFVIVGP